jgi:aspartyl-tRNA(Asn)/glutamyl-tRNA(Gln) amidotransferase subunit A
VNELADAAQIAGLKAAMDYSAVDYLKAMRVRTQIRDSFRQLFADVDLIVAPTKLEPPDLAMQPFDETPAVRPEQKGVWAGLVQASNLAGLPAITVPCGFVNGLPIGLQIVGPAFSENRVIAFAREFQRRTDFHKRHPVVDG